MRYVLVVIGLITLMLPTAARAQQPWFFAVLADPQLGMYAKDQNFSQETANFEFVIANLNRLHPRFVVICGDLVNRTGDRAEIAEYKRILRELDPSIPVYNVAGNHDVGNVPTHATVSDYRAEIGPDYYSFSNDSILGIVLDSNLIRAPQDDPGDAEQQERWLEKTLGQAKSKTDKQIVIFQHIPYFDKSVDEAENYFNIPEPARKTYLDIFAKAGVRYIFTGHTHKSGIVKDGDITEIITGAAGMPLGKSVSGFRVVAVTGHEFDSTWLCFGGIPNKLSVPVSTPCPQ
jgi:3',5'-cyclic AMP phosphodiesterase CpdA